MPGGTVTIGTGPTVSISETETISGLPNVRGGAARILATGKRVLCHAFVIEEGDDTAMPSEPPTAAWALPVFKKGKQNGN